MGSRSHTPCLFSFTPKENETKEKTPCRGGSFIFVRPEVVQLNRATQEFALRQTRRVFESYAVGLLLWRRTDTIPVKSDRCRSKSIADIPASFIRVHDRAALHRDLDGHAREAGRPGGSVRAPRAPAVPPGGHGECV